MPVQSLARARLRTRRPLLTLGLFLLALSLAGRERPAVPPVGIALPVAPDEAELEVIQPSDDTDMH